MYENVQIIHCSKHKHYYIHVIKNHNVPRFHAKQTLYHIMAIVGKNVCDFCEFDVKYSFEQKFDLT